MAYAALYDLDLVAMEVDAGSPPKRSETAFQQSLTRLKTGEAWPYSGEARSPHPSVRDLGILVETTFSRGNGRRCR